MIIWLWAVVFGLLTSACAAPTIHSHAVYQDPTAFVRLEFSPDGVREDPGSLHSHPVSLAEEQVRRIFQGLMVQQHRISLMSWILGEAELKAAFTDKEIDFLAPHIVEAFELAVPEEIVTFYLSYPLNSVKREVTSGAVFVKDNHMHVMLSNHRAIYGIPSYGIVYDQRYPTYSLAPRAFDLHYVPTKHIVPQTVSLLGKFLGEENDGEVVVDLTQVSILEM